MSISNDIWVYIACNHFVYGTRALLGLMPTNKKLYHLINDNKSQFRYAKIEHVNDIIDFVSNNSVLKALTIFTTGIDKIVGMYISKPYPFNQLDTITIRFNNRLDDTQTNQTKRLCDYITHAFPSVSRCILIGLFDYDALVCHWVSYYKKLENKNILVYFWNAKGRRGRDSYYMYYPTKEEAGFAKQLVKSLPYKVYYPLSVGIQYYACIRPTE
jgi:hypothetical protein